MEESMRKLTSLFGFMILTCALFSSCSDNKGTEPVQPTVPTVSTITVSAITETTAVCGGTVTSNGGAEVTARGVCWSTNATPTIGDNITTDGSGSGNLTSYLTGLTAGTQYNVRAYATNSAGTGYGSEQPFTTTTPSHLILLSSFDTDYEGWMEFGEGILIYVNSGGNPGGYIEFEDWEAGSGCFLAPDKFKGDLSAYSQGTLSFDLKNTVDNGSGVTAYYGLIRITSGTLYAEKNAVPDGSYLTEWTTYSIPLTADTWGVTSAQWDSILTNVTEVLIHMDPQGYFYDRSGLDNFCLTSPALKVQPTSNEVTQSNESHQSDEDD